MSRFAFIVRPSLAVACHCRNNGLSRASSPMTTPDDESGPAMVLRLPARMALIMMATV